MPLEFDAQEREAIDRIVARYPKKAAALLPVLHLAQDKFGALSVEAQLLVAKTLDVAPTRVREVVTFYEMFHEHREGQFHIEMCTNIACHLTGADLLMDHLKKRLQIEIGHQTEDGMFSLMEVECLASCGSGPMMKVGMDYYEGLDEAAIDALLDKFKRIGPKLDGRPYACGAEGPHVGPVKGFEPKLPVIQPQKAAPAQASPSADEASAKAVSAKAAPAKAPSAGEAPAKAAPAKAPSAGEAPAKAAPAKAPSAGDAPAKAAPAKAPTAAEASANAAPAKAPSAGEAPAKAAPSNEAPAKAPVNEAPAKAASDASPESASTKAPPSKPVPPARAGAAVNAAPDASANADAKNGEGTPSKPPGAALPSFDPPPLKSGEKTNK